jgi:hypothetical protein
MGLLRTLNRSAFICNIAFLLAVIILWMKNPVNPGLAALIIVMGFVLSVILNVIVNAWHLIRKVKKQTLQEIPAALIYLNAIFLVIQLILFIR